MNAQPAAQVQAGTQHSIQHRACLVREATEAEIDRMPAHVLWFYCRGQAAALWLEDGRITLAPVGEPSTEFILLIHGSTSRD